MAFVHRTTRDSNRVGLPSSCTPGNIGPGSYSVAKAISRARPSYAPFSSTAGRKIGSTGPASRLVTPGPGEYPITAKRSVQARESSNAFKSRSVRFSKGAGEDLADTPGPGAYSQRSQFARKFNRGGGGSVGGAMGVGGGVAGGAPPVTWVRVPSAPSIPAHNQSFGYEEGKFGELVQQQPPDTGHTGRRGDTVGPGDYQPPSTWKGAQSTDFGRSTTTRTNLSENDTPGPGSYLNPVPEADSLEAAQLQRSPPKMSSNFASRVTRNNGPSKGPGGAALTPGPGAYTVPSSFKRAGAEQSEDLQFFGSTCKRFDGNARGGSGPGPGAYSMGSGFRKVTAGQAYGRNNANAYGGGAGGGVGFHSTSTRFSEQEMAGSKSVNGAGPGSYETHTMYGELKKKVTGRTGVFGSTTKRFMRPLSDDTPGPGEQDAGEEVRVHGGGGGGPEADEEGRRRQRPLRGRPQPKQESSAFASGTNRGSYAAATDAPPPGAYDTRPSWATGPKNGKGVLSSGERRFAGAGGKPGIAGTPGPGAYTMRSSMRKPKPNRQNVMLSKERRFGGDSLASKVGRRKSKGGEDERKGWTEESSGGGGGGE
jgi:hypothetical protein